MKPTLICVPLLVALPFALAQQPATSAPQKSISSYMGLHTFPAKNQTSAQQQQDEMSCYQWAKQDSGFDPLATLNLQQQPPADGSAQPATPATLGAEAKGAPTATDARAAAGPGDATAPGPPPLPGSPPTAPAAAPSCPPPALPFTAQQQPPAVGSAQPAIPGAQGAKAKGAATATAASGAAGGPGDTPAPGAPPLPGSPAAALPSAPPVTPACAIQMLQKLDSFKKGFSACMEAKNYVVK